MCIKINIFELPFYRKLHKIYKFLLSQLFLIAANNGYYWPSLGFFRRWGFGYDNKTSQPFVHSFILFN